MSFDPRQIERTAPFLACFAVTPRRGGGLPPGCQVDRSVGLLYRPDSRTPLVEEVIAGCMAVFVEGDALVTCGVEPSDPDSIRQNAGSAAQPLTEGRSDQTDPDLVRLLDTSRVASDLTRAANDEEDPDLIRTSEYGFDDTVLTKADGDPSDPDTIRIAALFDLSTVETASDNSPDPDVIRGL